MNAEVPPDHGLAGAAPHDQVLAEQAGCGHLRVIHVGGSSYDVPVVHQDGIIDHLNSVARVGSV